MQQLLTGRQRLPGFAGGWQVKRLGDLGDTYGGLSGKTGADFGTGNSQYVPFMNVMGNVVIDPSDLERVRVAASEGQRQVRAGDLFFNASSETPEELGMCAVLLENLRGVYLNSFCFGFRLRERSTTTGLYLAYFFRSDVGRALLYSLAQGATRYNLSKASFKKLEVSLPESSERTAIAAVLSDMDAEIAALEVRREKTQLIKQGMMQELLTGRTRLV
jgi:type I restriction enzyme S subunit